MESHMEMLKTELWRIFKEPFTEPRGTVKKLKETFKKPQRTGKELQEINNEAQYYHNNDIIKLLHRDFLQRLLRTSNRGAI